MFIWLLIVMALLGAPLFALLGGAAMVGFHSIDYDAAIVAAEFQRIGQMPGLEAIPMFALAGYLLGAGNGPKRLVDVSEAWLGWLPGGLAVVAVVSCALFTAFTGASGVTIVALGGLLYPAMLSAGYPRRFVLGLLTASGSLGLLFAPSLPLILYGFVAAQMGSQPPVSVADLFWAGLLPGLLMVIVLAMMSMRQGWLLPRTGRFSLRKGMAAVRAAVWELPLPVLVLGAIFSGWLAVSEAAAMTAGYVLVVTCLIRRELSWSKFVAATSDAARMVGVLLIVLGMALALSNYMIDQEVPTRLFGWVSRHIDEAWLFLLCLNVFLLIVGMLLDIFSAIVILVPILLPLAQGFGIHPVHLGIVMLANLQLGYVTPPVGMNLFIASFRFGEPVLSLVRHSWPFLVALLACLLAITWIPWLSLAPL